VSVFVRHTHKEVPKEDIDSLLAIYGTLLSESSFCKNGEFENDVYTVNIRLKYLIPEFLPIRGKRARVYYHGIAPFCIVCNTPGHTKPECRNAPVPWSDYVQFLKGTGIPARLFEPIAENSYGASANTLGQNLFGFLTSTPKNSNNPENLLLSLLQGALSNANANPSQPPTTPTDQGIDPTFSASKPRNPEINPNFRAPGKSSANPGRGRGKAFQQLANSATPNFGRGRGRGRGKVDGEQPLNRGRGAYNFRQSK
jgi:hypothetical protein